MDFSELVSMLTNEYTVFSYVRSLQVSIPLKSKPEVSYVNNVTVSFIEARYLSWLMFKFRLSMRIFTPATTVKCKK